MIIYTNIYLYAAFSKEIPRCFQANKNLRFPKSRQRLHIGLQSNNVPSGGWVRVRLINPKVPKLSGNFP